MAKRERKQAIEKILIDLAHMLDTGWSPWEFEYSRYGVAMSASYDFQSEAGLKKNINPAVCLYFNYDRPLSDVRIMFLGKPSQYLNRTYGLREIIAGEVLERLESAAIGHDQFALYVAQQRIV